jgi:hypothetical protein
MKYSSIAHHFACCHKFTLKEENGEKFTEMEMICKFKDSDVELYLAKILGETDIDFKRCLALNNLILHA